MSRLEKNCVPYEGNEPYLYYAFCQSDAAKAVPVLEGLYRRGCRVWYDSGSSRTQRLERTCHASLAVIFMSANAMADRDEVKSTTLYCQSKGVPVVVIDAVENNDLSTGFTGKVFHVDFSGHQNQLERDLLQTGAITQEMFGEIPLRKKQPIWKLVLTFVLAAAVAVLGSAYAFGFFAPKDEISFCDAVIEEAVRQCAGSPITREGASAVVRLRLNAVPETLEDLDKLERLERIEIPAEAVQRFALFTDRYQLVVYAGEEG